MIIRYCLSLVSAGRVAADDEEPSPSFNCRARHSRRVSVYSIRESGTQEGIQRGQRSAKTRDNSAPEFAPEDLHFEGSRPGQLPDAEEAKEREKEERARASSCRRRRRLLEHPGTPSPRGRASTTNGEYGAEKSHGAMIRTLRRALGEKLEKLRAQVPTTCADAL